MRALLSSILFIAAFDHSGNAQTTHLTDTSKSTVIGPCFASVTNSGPLYIVQTKSTLYQLLSADLIQPQEIEKMDIKTNLAENTSIYGSKAANGLVILTLKLNQELAVIKRLGENLVKL